MFVTLYNADSFNLFKNRTNIQQLNKFDLAGC